MCKIKFDLWSVTQSTITLNYRITEDRNILFEYSCTVNFCLLKVTNTVND